MGPSPVPDEIGTVFRFGGMMEFHAAYQNRWGASCPPGTATLFVSSPYFSGGGDTFNLADLPHATWVQLKDRDGRPIPLEVFVDHTGVSGRWLR